MTERIRWSILVWIAVVGFDFFFFLTFAVILEARGVLILIALISLLTILAFRSSQLIIMANQNEIHVGRAHIERKYIGKVTVLDKEAMRLARTRDIDPAAYLNIRFWIPTGVRIDITDASDPTPYWLISSRKNKELAEYLSGQ